MICPKCGAPLGEDGLCPNCLPGNLREMRKEEISGYDGVTIDENDSGQRSSGDGYGFWGQGSSHTSRGTGYGNGNIRIVSGGSLFTKLIIAGFIALLLAAFVFVALPLVVILAVSALVVYFLYSLFV